MMRFFTCAKLLIPSLVPQSNIQELFSIGDVAKDSWK